MSRPFRISLMALNAAGGSGVPRYTATLARALDEVSGEFPELELSLVTTPAGAARVAPRRMAVHRLPARLPAGPVFRLALEQAAAPFLRSDLLHYFDVGGPLLAPGRPFVTTFHDASLHRRVDSYLTWARRLHKGRLYHWALPRARRIVAVSQFAKDEAVRCFAADPARIVVVHSGPGLTPLPERGAPPSRPPFLLFVGTLTSRKNVPFLIRAYARAGAPVDLLLAGDPVEGAERAKIGEAIERSGRRDRIHLVASPPDEELDRLYRGAVGLVLPSLYEGFGFPALEAMERGCPVLASDIPAFREVSGSGAMLLPLDEEAWAAAVGRLASDAGLRTELVARGYETVRRYSWLETARGVCRLFLGLADGSSERA